VRKLVNLGLMSASTGPGTDFPDRDFEEFRSRVRFKVSYDVGFYCPDVDDLVQETMTRLMVAHRSGKILNPDAIGAFVNGICRNVVSEYRRKNLHNEPMPEVVPEPENRRIPEAEAFELRQAIAHGLDQLPDRDRKILREFYLEEKPRADIMRQMGLSDENFRVALFRAKERFRAIYLQHAKHRAGFGHS
jgi:RNA polymerase sigma-70 factor (ECF subfamily)